MKIWTMILIFFNLKIKKEDVLLEATKMYEAIAKSYWQLELHKYSSLQSQDMNIESNVSE